MGLVYGDDDRVTAWVARQCGATHPPPAHVSIGFERDGTLVAGAYFDSRTKTNLFTHIANTTPGLHLGFVSAILQYAYNQCSVNRMSLMVRDDNDACLRLVQALGATLEGRLRNGHEAGDLLWFVLWKTDEFPQRVLRRAAKERNYGW